MARHIPKSNKAVRASATTGNRQRPKKRTGKQAPGNGQALDQDDLPRPASLPIKGAFSVEDLVVWSGLSRSTIYKDVKSEKLKKTKKGGRTLVLYDNAQAWLKNM